MKKNISTMAILALIGLLSACVTIHIYFPAASAEKVADKIIDEVWQLKDGAPTSTEKPENVPVTQPAK